MAWPPTTHQDVQDRVDLLAHGRTTTQKSTASLTANAYEATTVLLGATGAVYRVAANKPCRVRLYTTTAKRDSDLTRTIGVDPTGDHGLLLEVVLTTSLLSLDLSPIALVVDLKATPDGLIPATITNTDTSTGVVTVTFTHAKIEV